eukprot:CAMPEP_0181249588 /NCGR_PEP_ID=MMETSP1096-20121128/45842_1 /TAXON_ID=156174 ORGANISM="Chrysochromulina ericina, Strain CCMP281" /NCGR_SAMPLE_ID=MMETSP1096 /ASSEMBLY_ACC=CAM_ASM_000453 /LENGTH=186 /DNA_ID=CAMNT_0023346951 /DNA_START=294 /DNA_END=856 /DNA_ORIENTATION=+
MGFKAAAAVLRAHVLEEAEVEQYGPSSSSSALSVSVQFFEQGRTLVDSKWAGWAKAKEGDDVAAPRKGGVALRGPWVPMGSGPSAPRWHDGAVFACAVHAASQAAAAHHPSARHPNAAFSARVGECAGAVVGRVQRVSWACSYETRGTSMPMATSAGHLHFSGTRAGAGTAELELAAVRCLSPRIT